MGRYRQRYPQPPLGARLPAAAPSGNQYVYDPTLNITAAADCSSVTVWGGDWPQVQNDVVFVSLYNGGSSYGGGAVLIPSPPWNVDNPGTEVGQVGGIITHNFGNDTGKFDEQTWAAIATDTVFGTTVGAAMVTCPGGTAIPVPGTGGSGRGSGGVILGGHGVGGHVVN